MVCGCMYIIHTPNKEGRKNGLLYKGGGGGRKGERERWGLGEEGEVQLNFGNGHRIASHKCTTAILGPAPISAASTYEYWYQLAHEATDILTHTHMTLTHTHMQLTHTQYTNTCT